MKSSAAIDCIQLMAVREEISNPPTGDEVLTALTAGSNGLLPDIMKCCGGPLLDFIVLFGIERERYTCRMT